MSEVELTVARFTQNDRAAWLAASLKILSEPERVRVGPDVQP